MDTKYSVVELLKKFDKGEERYNHDPTFNTIIELLSTGADVFQMMGILFNQLDTYKTLYFNSCFQTKIQVINPFNMQKLQKLIDYCRGEISLSINSHKGEYLSVEDYLNTLIELDIVDPLEDLVYSKEMIEKDTIIELQFYPDTSIGSYTIIHYDLEEAVDKALEILNIK